MPVDSVVWAERARAKAPYGQGDEWYDLIMEQPEENRKAEYMRLLALQSDLGMSTSQLAVEPEPEPDEDSVYEEALDTVQEDATVETDSAQLVRHCRDTVSTSCALNF